MRNDNYININLNSDKFLYNQHVQIPNQYNPNNDPRFKPMYSNKPVKPDPSYGNNLLYNQIYENQISSIKKISNGLIYEQGKDIDKYKQDLDYRLNQLKKSDLKKIKDKQIQRMLQNRRIQGGFDSESDDSEERNENPKHQQALMDLFEKLILEKFTGMGNDFLTFGIRNDDQSNDEDEDDDYDSELFSTRNHLRKKYEPLKFSEIGALSLKNQNGGSLPQYGKDYKNIFSNSHSKKNLNTMDNMLKTLKSPKSNKDDFKGLEDTPKNKVITQKFSNKSNLQEPLENNPLGSNLRNPINNQLESPNINQFGLISTSPNNFGIYNNNNNNNKYGLRPRRNLLNDRNQINSNINRLDDDNDLSNESNDNISLMSEEILTKKVKARSNLRNILWVMVYDTILSNRVKESIILRNNIKRHKIDKEFNNAYRDFQAFFCTYLEKIFYTFYNDTRPLILIEGLETQFFGGVKKFTEKELEKRCACIGVTSIDLVIKLFDILATNTTEEKLKRETLNFFCEISEDRGLIPEGFLFEFELNRLKFSHYGTLKGMDPSKSKMILGMAILVKLLLTKFFFRPFEVTKYKSFSITIQRNLLTLGSIILHIFLDWIREDNPEIPENQDHLPSQLKNEPRDIRIITDINIIDSKTKLKKEVQLERDYEEKADVDGIIFGALTKEDLSYFFTAKALVAENIRDHMLSWLDKIYALTHDLIPPEDPKYGKVDGEYLENIKMEFELNDIAKKHPVS